jgi:hypothetical protein
MEYMGRKKFARILRTSAHLSFRKRILIADFPEWLALVLKMCWRRSCRFSRFARNIQGKVLSRIYAEHGYANKALVRDSDRLKEPQDSL